MSTDATSDPAPARWQAQAQFEVSDEDTARSVGSGSLPVLATPRLLAWCEAVTCQVADALIAAESMSSDGPTTQRTSVGTRVTLDHVAASALGSTVLVTAALDSQDGRLLQFVVNVHAVGQATSPTPVLATGRITRVIVDQARFMQRVGAADKST